MKRHVQVHLVNGENQVFKCNNIVKTSQGYLFECDDKNRTFLIKDVDSIDDPFKLPNGFKIDKNKEY